MTTAGRKIWVWAVPVGIAIVAIVAAVVIGLYFMGNAATIRGTSAYKEAIRRVGAYPRVRQRLGNPLEAESGVEGTLQISGQNGYADFTIPVSGPKGKGTIGVEALLNGGTWSYQHLALRVEGDSKPIIVEGQQPRFEVPSAEDPSVSVSVPEGEIADIPTGTSPPERTEPAEETPPQETPPQETPPQETPPQETPPQETPPQETPPQETPPQETPPTEVPEAESPESKTAPVASPKPETPDAETPEKGESTEEKPLKSSS